MFLQSLFPSSIGIIEGCERWNHNTIVVSALPRRRKIQCHKKYFSYLYVLSMLLLLSITIFFRMQFMFFRYRKRFQIVNFIISNNKTISSCTARNYNRTNYISNNQKQLYILSYAAQAPLYSTSTNLGK